MFSRSNRPKPLQPGPGQESVWDYPRPPRIEAASRHIQVIFNGEVIAETRRALRVLETSHPPVYYIPLEDVRSDALTPTRRSTFCEFKGAARYYTISVGGKTATESAWYYPDPSPGYAALRDHVAFYPDRVGACYVDGERVHAQAGDFYGGWITAGIVGPFKGEPGTMGW
ncbi:MAG: DUF427 domain-containing protein [Ktedonobacterales bacterium]